MKPTFKQKFSYFFDNTLSRGTGAIIAWLSILTVVLVLLFSVIYLLVGVHFEDTGELNFLQAFWESLMRSLDPGSVAGDTKWALRAVGILVTISGIFILSSLIGILSAGLANKIDDLRKGHSLVLSKNHTLIIGWSQKIFFILNELIIANENQKKPSIVILDERDKPEMDEEIRQNLPNTKNTKIITRSGNTLDIKALNIVNPDEAKSIIILPPDNLEDESKDIHVIKTLLALIFNPARTKKEYHVVSEIKNFENLDAASVVGKHEASIIYSQDIISRISAQTCHQPGLSVIYMGLVSFDGDEIYFSDIESLYGKTYKEALFAFEDSSVIGIRKDNGAILINPTPDTFIEKGDRVIAISDDDDTVIPTMKTTFEIDNSTIVSKERSSSIKKENNIILGWNQRAKGIICELDQYLENGSVMSVITLTELSQEEKEEVEKELKNQKIEFNVGDYTKRNVLEKLNITNYDNIIILSNINVSQQEADAYTLLSLVLIRDIANEKGIKAKIISEMNDLKNRELADVTEADDFIISQDLISRILAQISENKELKNVYDILFSSEGSEIYLKDADNYVLTEKPVNFYTILESAANKNETAIGYQIKEYAHNSSKNYGIVVNPDKSEIITLKKGDKIIVLSED